MASVQSGSEEWVAAYDSLGNLINLGSNTAFEVEQTFGFTPARRLEQVHVQAPGRANQAFFAFDSDARMSSASNSADPTRRRIFSYDGSQLIALGEQYLNPTTQALETEWQYAIGHGPFGPSLLKDLTGQGNDYFIFTDHLGTPFGWLNPHTNQVFVTPYNSYGELLATPANQPAPYLQGNVATHGFQLPPLPGFAFAPIGLGGHFYDADSGLVAMHFRFMHPRLAHFTTVDFRAPDIYDITTLTEPYAYARGNPILYVDKDGRIAPLAAVLYNLAKKGAVSALIDAMSQLVFAYLFDPDVHTWEAAAKKINLWQVGRAAIEGMVPWKPPGGKIGSALLSAAGDVATDALNEKDYNWEKALKTFAFSLAADLGSQSLGWLRKRYKNEEIAAGLKKAGLPDDKIKKLTGIEHPKPKRMSKEQAKKRVETFIHQIPDDVLAKARAADTLPRKAKILQKAGVEPDQVSALMIAGKVCFVAGTQVLVPGGTKNIEDVKEGDLVLTWDPEQGVIEGKVEATFVTHPSELAALTFGEPGQKQTIQTTWNHPFYVVELADFVDVPALEPGQHLLSETGHAIPIQSIEPIRGPPTNQAKTTPANASDGSPNKTGPNAEAQVEPATYTTYNFSVQTTHTYFVQQTKSSSNAALVHNQNNLECVIPGSPRKAPGSWVKKSESLGTGADFQAKAVPGRDGFTYRVDFDNPNPRGRSYVDFDDFDSINSKLIDVKKSIRTTKKGLDQVKRQLGAARQHGVGVVWKVPTRAQKLRAEAFFFKRKKILGIDVEIFE